WSSLKRNGFSYTSDKGDIHHNEQRISDDLYDFIQVVFLTNSGTEATELALMIARLYNGCHDIISHRNGYHGNASTTKGAIAQRIYRYVVVQECLKFSGFACQLLS
ncbi:alanine--glyoxylate aminotransferase 2 homolog 3, mitochondrial, partial [Tanacetum coccineum]